MDPGTITLDRESFKALASEVRVEILKQLEGHRMTVTDLSHAMSLAKPTLLEHLERLVAAGLVTKADEGRKWIYYDLTKRGRSILHPHQVKIMLSLALSIAMVSAGAVAILAAATQAPTFSGGPTGTGAVDWFTEGRGGVPEALAAGAPAPWGLIAILLAVIPLVVGLLYYRAGRDLIASVRMQIGS